MQLFTAVDKATGWPKIIEIDNKRSEAIWTLFDNEWLLQYPRPRRVAQYNDCEFFGEDFQGLFQNYGIQSVPTTVKSPTANSPV